MSSGVLVLVALLVLTSLARAEEPDYASLVAEAIAAQEAGDYARARVLFASAHEREPSARTLRGMGVAAFQAGNAVQAVVDLNASLEHPVKPLDESLRADVLLLLDLARKSVGSYRVQADPADATLLVDGGPPTRDIDGGVLLLPGWHSLSLSAPGHVSQALDVEARAGARESLRVVLAALQPTPLPPVASTSSVPAREKALPAAPSREDERVRHLRAGMWFSLSLGSAFALSAGVASIVGNKRVGDIEQRCGDVCDDDDVAREVEDAHLVGLARAVNVTAVAAVTGFGAALGLWLWQRRSASHEQSVSVSGTRLAYSLSF